MDGKKKLEILLSDLNVKKGDLIFLHTSFKRLAYLSLTAEQILGTIIELLGPNGTLVLPAYAWKKTWEGYKNYYNERPIFNVRQTSANIGYIPETFRLMPGVGRSLNYCLSVCAYGKLADIITKDQEKVLHYYGECSSFAALKENNVKILGLGVSLNTTSLSPMVDYALGDRHSHRVFTEKPEIGIVIDDKGRRYETQSYWLLPDYVRLTKPSRVIEDSRKLKNALCRKDEGTTIQFCYEFNIYYNEALQLALTSLNRSMPIPWLENY